MDDSVITCGEIIDAEAKSQVGETKTIPTNFNEKKQPVKHESLLAFLLITIVLLIAVSNYCYLIKYRAKQKHFLPFHVTNNKLKQFIY